MGKNIEQHKFKDMKYKLIGIINTIPKTGEIVSDKNDYMLDGINIIYTAISNYNNIGEQLTNILNDSNYNIINPCLEYLSNMKDTINNIYSNTQSLYNSYIAAQTINNFESIVTQLGSLVTLVTNSQTLIMDNCQYIVNNLTTLVTQNELINLVITLELFPSSFLGLKDQINNEIIGIIFNFTRNFHHE